jgi:hypothetical protein
MLKVMSLNLSGNSVHAQRHHFLFFYQLFLTAKSTSILLFDWNRNVTHLNGQNKLNKKPVNILLKFFFVLIADRYINLAIENNPVPLDY